MAAYNTSRFTFQEFGSNANVPNSSTARLMYYLDCVCTVLDLNDNREIQSYRNYRNYRFMSRADKIVILSLCKLFDPTILDETVFFQSENLDGSSNTFFEIGQVRTTVESLAGLVIGGVRMRATKVMFYKLIWMKTYYYDALEDLQDELDGCIIS